MNTKIIYVVSILMSLCFTACSSDFLKEYSQDLARVQTIDDLNELLVGDCLLPKGYVNVQNYNLVLRNYNYAMLHFMSDELTENTSPAEDPDREGAGLRETFFPYFTWQQNLYQDTEGKNTFESNENYLWTLAYEKINNCNVVVEAAREFSAKTESERNQLQIIQGEALYLRASYYLMLVNLYGKPYAPQTANTDLAVPVKLSASVEDKEFQRATVAEVYGQIVADLAEAENCLGQQSNPVSIYHSGLEAVYILRSRVALYMQDWKNAETYAKKALDKNDYLQDLAALSDDQFPMSKDNKEVVFSNGSSCFGNILQLHPQKYSSWSYYNPTWYVSDNLYELFDDNDKRKSTYFTTEDDRYDHRPTYHKIDNRDASFGVYKTVSDVFSVRTAEAYLNMAEAKAEMGEDAEACRWLAKLRSNRVADAGNVSFSGAQLVQFVREERERELCFEGHRWFDLRRYSVDEKYPYSKEIVHTMTYYSYTNYSYIPVRTNQYRLEKNDAAYVLDIPKSVREFQPSIGTNLRPVRNPFRSDEIDNGDEGDDDYDW